METARLLLVQAQSLAVRRAGDGGHRLGEWVAGTRYPAGQQDWWATCQRCALVVWVLALDDGRGIVQHVPDECRPE